MFRMHPIFSGESAAFVPEHVEITLYVPASSLDEARETASKAFAHLIQSRRELVMKKHVVRDAVYTEIVKRHLTDNQIEYYQGGAHAHILEQEFFTSGLPDPIVSFTGARLPDGMTSNFVLILTHLWDG